jgi:TP901 family phage tail tape measure protein
MTEVGRATVIIDADDSRLKTSLAKAQQDTAAGVAGIEQNLRGQLGAGLTGSLSGGNWKNAGKALGADLVQGITAPLGALGNVAGSAALAMGPVGIAAVAGVAAAGALGAASSRAAMEWEAGMAQISKTTGIEKGTEAFNELDSSLTNLYSRMPTTVAEIQSVAAAAGSLGIEKDSIAGFTEVALQMGSAFDMPAEEAATAIGKIKGQLKSLPEGVQDSSEFARQFGSAVDYVGNNFNATEKDVLDFSTRVAGSMSSLGAGAYEVAGWGGMLSSVFPSAERAAGSFDALLNQLTTNEKSQAEAASLLGMSTEEFMQAMSTDPSDTILRIGSALEGLPAEKLLTTAKTLGGSYGMDALVKMVGHTDEWRQSIEDTVEAGKKGESIGESFEAGADNMKSSLQVLKNSFNAILKDIGGPINAALSPMISSVAGSLNAVRQIGENLWEPMTAGLGPLITGITQVTGMIGTMGGMNLSVLVSGTSALNTAFRTGKAYVEAFKEEILATITSSSQFQALAGALDSIKSKLSEVGAFWGDIFGDIVDGLANAIPTAVSGAVNALGSLASQGLNKIGLGGLAEGASSLFGDVTAFLDRVSVRAKEKLGIATEEAVETGTEKGMESGASNAEDGIASSVERAVSAGASSGFAAQNASMDSAYKAAVSSGVSPQIAGWQQYGGVNSSWAELNDLIALDRINAQTRSVKKDTGDLYAVQDGVQVRVHYNIDKNDTLYTLSLNGQKMAEDRYTSQEEAIEDLFKQADYPLLESTSLTLQGRGGDLAKLQMDQQIQPITNFMVDRFGDMGSQASTALGGSLKTGLDSVSAFMKNTWYNDLANLGSVAGSVIGGGLAEMGAKANSSLDSIQSKTKQASVGFNQLESAMKDCTETMSEFGLWQEQNAEELFQGSYIGAGGEQYLDWKLNQIQSIAATQKAMASVGGAVLGKDYTDFQMSPSLDTSAAESQWSSFQSKLSEEQKVPITVDDSQAMSAIAAIDAAAGAAVTKPVYVQQIGGYGGGGGYGEPISSYWDNPYDSPFGNPYSFAEGDVFVPEPTLAVVGDRPGGEWIGGIDQAIERFGGGSGQVVINAPVTIQGNVYGISDLDAYMDERDRQLEAKLSNARKR